MKLNKEKALIVLAIVVIALVMIKFSGPKKTSEVCDNMLDDNSNGLVDCADEDCSDWPGCLPGPSDDDDDSADDDDSSSSGG